MKDVEIMERNGVEFIRLTNNWESKKCRVYMGYYYHIKKVVAAIFIHNNDFDQTRLEDSKKLKLFALITYLSINLDIIARDPNFVLSKHTYRAIARQLLEGINIIHTSEIIIGNIMTKDILLHAQYGSVKAPEINGQNLVRTEKSDMWSIGVVLYKLATHEYPKVEKYQGPFSRAVLKRIQRPNSIQDNELWDLLFSLLNFDIDYRHTATQALQTPYFNSERAKAEITKEAKLITNQRTQATERGVDWILKYDLEPSFIAPSSEIKVLNYFLQQLQH
ncbi:MAG: hypothetical protein EZS28_016890 [Streblomastix strix]|uniref:Protein kinase domain-containing protein n=1 Tax=Streblomastix strix TaxID=222440 RepID=A0A5J4VYB0_9EUKA|nr:MAG: hypothetical protein EZS28_016890 [Streblomastix strix]